MRGTPQPLNPHRHRHRHPNLNPRSEVEVEPPNPKPTPPTSEPGSEPEPDRCTRGVTSRPGGRNVDMLSVFTDKELRKWFETSGYSSPPLNKTDERRAARNEQNDRLCKLQYMLQQMQHGLELTIARRCRGWTPDT